MPLNAGHGLVVDLAVLGLWLNSMISKVVSDVNDSEYWVVLKRFMAVCVWRTLNSLKNETIWLRVA